MISFWCKLIDHQISQGGLCSDENTKKLPFGMQMLGYLSTDIIRFEKQTVTTVTLEEQIISKDKHPSNFAPNWGYCVSYPSNIFCSMWQFWKLENITQIFPNFSCMGNIQSPEAFRPIAFTRKYFREECNKQQSQGKLWNAHSKSYQTSSSGLIHLSFA